MLVRGPISGLMKRSFKCTNIFSFDLGLGTILHAQEIDKEVIVLNLYGLYVDWVSCWDKDFFHESA
jgi:hypothetical protein